MPHMIQPRSVLAVRDLEASTRYYTEVIGFILDPIKAPGWSFLTRKLDALHGEFVARGAEAVVPIGNRSHGHREFVIQTPDGHRVLFGAPLAP